MTASHNVPPASPSGQNTNHSLGLALLPVGILILLLAFTVSIFGDDATAGPSQMALILAGLSVVLCARTVGVGWAVLEKSIIHSVSFVSQSIFILLLVGALIGTWITAGIVPTLIVYGLEILVPQVLLLTAAVICAMVSIISGSSWSTAGTLGLAFMGIGTALNVPPPMTAGAVVSGAYFGDKMSPFSETTNLAASITGTDLFDHIRHMVYTTGPSFVIACAVFLLIGFYGEVGQYKPAKIEAVQNELKKYFAINPILLLPIPVLFYFIMRKTPAILAILYATLMGGLLAAIFQPDRLLALAGSEGFGPVAVFKGFIIAAAQGFEMQTSLPVVDSLLNRGGMSSMLNTVWLILSAMFFSGAMEGAGFLYRIAVAIVRLASTTGRLIASSVGTGVFMNLTASEQYLALVVTGRMFAPAYREKGLHSKNLSRALEDSGTLTSALVPWNTCGAYMAGTLGVATLAYAPFAILNWLNPLISIGLGFSGYAIAPADQDH